MKSTHLAITAFAIAGLISMPFASKAECIKTAKQTYKSAVHECKAMKGKEKKQCMHEAKSQMKQSKAACTD